MAIPKGLFNPKNAVESTGGFREGIIQVDSSVYKVHRNRTGEGQAELAPVMALCWNITRLDEEQEVMTNEDNEPLTEELIFSGGGKSLAQVHPGRADSPDDPEIEDAGVAVNTEGPTVYLVNQDWFPHKKSGMTQLMESLKEKGLKEEYLDRVWAPDYVGCVFEMKNKTSDDKMTRPGPDGKDREYPINYKVVHRIIRGPGQSAASAKGKKGKAGAGAGAGTGTGTGATASGEHSGTAASNGKVDLAEAELAPILNSLSAERDGTSMSWKSLSATISRVLVSSTIDPKLHVPMLTLIKDFGWLVKNGPKYDMVYDAETNYIAFGEQKAKTTA